MFGLTKTYKIRPTLVHTPDLNMDPLYRHSVAPFVRMYIFKKNYRCDQTKLGARVIDIGTRSQNLPTAQLGLAPLKFLADIAPLTSSSIRRSKEL